MFERVGSGFPGLTPIYYNPRLGPHFIRRLLGEMNVTVSRDRRQATDWLASGKFVLCIGCADVEHASKDGMAVSELDRRHLKEAGSNSMRIDIPKDNVLPAARRENGVKYIVTGFLNPEPPSKLIEELVGRKRAR